MMRQAGTAWRTAGRAAGMGLLMLAVGCSAARAQNVNALFPDTPPQDRIMIYEGANYRGRALAVGTQMADLSSVNMGGRVGSFIIQTGRWQMCTKPGYRGRCVVSDQSLRDVARLGMRRQIMSIRRLDT